MKALHDECMHAEDGWLNICDAKLYTHGLALEVKYHEQSSGAHCIDVIPLTFVE